MPQAGGLFQVLVSSQGSSTVSVFSATAGQATATFLAPLAVNNVSSNSSFAGAFLIPTSSLRLASLSDSQIAIAGLSLSSFSSLNNLGFSTTITAALVAVEGNSYSTVAVLDFGTQQDDESGDGRGRMPWLSNRYPIGDQSPLKRFVIGLDEAIEKYRRNTDESHHSEDDPAPQKDVWTEDLFHRSRPFRAPTRHPSQISSLCCARF